MEEATQIFADQAKGLIDGGVEMKRIINHKQLKLVLVASGIFASFHLKLLGRSETCD